MIVTAIFYYGANEISICVAHVIKHIKVLCCKNSDTKYMYVT